MSTKIELKKAENGYLISVIGSDNTITNMHITGTIHTGSGNGAYYYKTGSKFGVNCSIDAILNNVRVARRWN